MIDILFILTISLLVSFIFSEIFFRLKYPRVIGYIFAGIFLGYPFFSGLFFPEGNFFAALEENNPPAVIIVSVTYPIFVQRRSIECSLSYRGDGNFHSFKSSL